MIKKIIKEFLTINIAIALIVGIIICRILSNLDFINALIRTVQIILIVKMSLITKRNNYYITIPFMVLILFVTVKLRLIFYR